MSNVLPPTAQQAVRSAYRARFIVAGSLVAIACALLAILALLPSFLVLVISGNASSAARSSASASATADSAAIAQAQALVAALSPIVSATTTPTDAIRAAIAARPAGVTVGHITYTSGAPGTLMLVGSGQTPSGISAYREALAADPHFTSVSVPVSDLVGAQGGQFSITASGNF